MNSPAFLYSYIFVMMKTVMICWSKSFKVLPVKVQVLLDSLVERGYNIAVGDWYGIDYWVQIYLNCKRYKNYSVWTAEDNPVMMHRHGTSISRVLAYGKSWYEKTAVKNTEMMKSSDVVVCIRDWRQAGVDLIQRAMYLKKEIVVFYLDEWYKWETQVVSLLKSKWALLF